MCVVVVIGSANTEVILTGVDQHIPAGKTTCSSVTEGLVGGSAMNWTHWLRILDASVVPLCPIGTDAEGEGIVRALVERGATGNNGRTDEPFQRFPGTTSKSFILVGRGERSVITRRGDCEGPWGSAVEARLQRIIGELRGRPFVAMLGNIPSDASSLEVTPRILRLLNQSHVNLIYANLGRAQYGHCHHQWKDSWGMMDWVQLDLSEARTFVGECLRCESCRAAVGWPDGDDVESIRPKLSTIMKWFCKTQSRAVVTLAHAGAVAVARDCPGQLFFSWPQLPDQKVVDPTGAGDAFGAGMVYAMMKLAPCKHAVSHERCRDTSVPGCSHPDCYRRALKFGSLLGVRACQAIGGSGAKAGRAELLEDYSRILHTPRFEEVGSLDACAQLLHVLDQL